MTTRNVFCYEQAQFSFKLCSVGSVTMPCCCVMDVGAAGVLHPLEGHREACGYPSDADGFGTSTKFIMSCVA